jgi:hypothetical protein
MCERGWPDELDALIVAPANRRLLRENGRLRVIHAVVAALTVTPVRTYHWASVECVEQRECCPA